MSAATQLPEMVEDYARPPIVEAVIERRFAKPIDFKLADRLRRRFEKEYRTVKPLAELSFSIPAQGVAPGIAQSPLGFRLSNESGTIIIGVTTHGIAYSRLAPYPGWSEFSGGASTIFGEARDITRLVPLSRIGVRYVNRLDIPGLESASDQDRLATYIHVRPNYPGSVIPAMRGFTLQCVFDVQIPECMGTVIVATVPSPVPRHTSILFDIDIGKNVNVPQSEREIEILLNLMRTEKNRIFNESLTEQMKGHFR